MCLNSVSKHIVVLERAGLVRRQRVGREHVIFFDPKPLEILMDWVETQCGRKAREVADRTSQHQDKVVSRVRRRARRSR